VPYFQHAESSLSLSTLLFLGYAAHVQTWGWVKTYECTVFGGKKCPAIATIIGYHKPGFRAGAASPCRCQATLAQASSPLHSSCQTGTSGGDGPKIDIGTTQDGDV